MSRENHRRIKTSLSIVVGIVLLFSTAISAGSAFSIQSSPDSKASTPIRHIVIIMQENHAFDNFFGTYPGLSPPYALNMTECDPLNLTQADSPCIKPFNADNDSAQIQGNDLIHNWNASHVAYNNGSMNGFVYAQLLDHQEDPQDAMAYYTNATIPNYWDYASYYSLDANFFSSELSYSYPNHLFLVAAQSGGCAQCSPSFSLKFGTILSELDKAKLAWRSYAGDWNTNYDCTKVTKGDFSSLSQVFWNVVPDFPAVELNPSECSNIQNLNDLFSNLTKGYLPSVAFVTPYDNVSDHPSESTLAASQLYITKIINAISSNATLWKSTAIFITWDEFGGYSDQVVPDQVDALGYGFRVPLLVISPYTVRGAIYYGEAGVQEDFSSLLTTIEQNWHLGHLTNRDKSEYSLFYMLNFSESPRPPLILPSNILATFPLSDCTLCKVGFGLWPVSVSDPPSYSIPSYYNLADENSSNAS